MVLILHRQTFVRKQLKAKPGFKKGEMCHCLKLKRLGTYFSQYSFPAVLCHNESVPHAKIVLIMNRSVKLIIK